MCGIAGIHILNPERAPSYLKMEKAIDRMLAAIDHRGGDATGFIAIGQDGDKEWQKASCKANEFYMERRSIPYRTRSVLMHTRMATQGSAAFPENNHPVNRGSVYVVHNGHVFNDAEVFKKTNRNRYGQVDSEAIAAVVAKFGIMRTHKAMEEIRGSAAIGVVDETRPGIMALARGSSSPLMFYHNDNIALFASTASAIQAGWNTLYGTPPNYSNIEDIDEGVALYLDDKVTREKFHTDSYYTYVYAGKKDDEKNKSDHHKNTWDEQAWGHASDYGLGCWDEDEFYGPAYSSTKGSRAIILCQHGIREHDCDVCNPDDYDGSYLPLKRDEAFLDREMDSYLSAKKCDLCANYFPEDELKEVKDMSDTWEFCEDCLVEMWDVVEDIDSSRKKSIHSTSMDEHVTI